MDNTGYSVIILLQTNLKNMPEEKESKSKKHFYTSVVKSILRFVGCGIVLVTKDPYLAICGLSAFFFAAEVLGIVEEL